MAHASLTELAARTAERLANPLRSIDLSDWFEEHLINGDFCALNNAAAQQAEAKMDDPIVDVKAFCANCQDKFMEADNQGATCRVEEGRAMFLLGVELSRRAGEQGPSPRQDSSRRPSPICDSRSGRVSNSQLPTPARRGDVLCRLEETDRFLHYIASLAWVVAEAPEDLPLGEDFWSEIHHQASEAELKFRKLSKAIEQCDDTVVLEIADKLDAAETAPNDGQRKAIETAGGAR